MRTRRASRRLALLVVLAGIALGAAASTRGGGRDLRLTAPPETLAAWRAVLPAHRGAAFGERAIVVLRTPSVAERVAAGGRATPAQERAWAEQAVAAQERVVRRLASAGLELRPELRFARVLDGFSARLGAGSVPRVELDPDVAGVYPVRSLEPAYAASGAQSVVPGSHDGLDGRGVAVALLSPREGRARLARLVRRVAPRASVRPVAPGGRSDELLGALDRVAGTARIALVPVVEPYAAFPDSPETRAVAGAAALGTLVVAAAGNDGPAAGAGDVGAPASAPAALAVGAADARPRLPRIRVVLHGRGGDRSGTLPLAGGVAPAGTLALGVVRPRGSPPLGLFSRDGGSLVAGRAVVVRSAAEVRPAVAAGAAAVLVDGTVVPGAVRADVPVVAIAPGAARPLETARRVTLAPAAPAPNPRRGRPAVFSSTGPDLVLAPGVAVATLSGTGAAAAVAAGEAALAAQAHPGLSPRRLRALLLRALGGTHARRAARPRVPLLRSVRLVPRAFAAADTAPARLTVEAGSRRGLVPVARLDLVLRRGRTRLGTLARLRDLLPGTYVFGLTGRSPAGARLPPGEYAVDVVAVPVEGGPASRKTVRFELR